MKNREQRNKKDNRKFVAGISWRLFGTLTLFVVLVLVIMWVFQVALLNRFYIQSKMYEFDETDFVVSEAAGDNLAMKSLVFTRSVDTDTCIRVFKVVDGVAEEIASSDVNIGCMIHHITGESLYELYSSAKANGGKYTQRIASTHENKKELTTVRVTLMQGDDGYEYIMMQDSELLPLRATVATLERQFGWIMSIMIVGALIVAFAMSRIICKPMARMGRSARKLAKGDYNERFIGGGYREADELADALNYASAELAKSDDLQKELVANISHDIRTPLTMIKGYSEVMRDIPDENTPENVQVIIDETERLSELVNDMLDLSKIKSGMRAPEIEVFNITETIEAVLLRYEKLTEKDNYDISFESESGVCVSADRTMILQVIYNLVNNAINYTGEDKKVVIKQSVENGRIRISVSDTGEGISEKDIPYIWDRYYKVDKVHKRSRVGTGLGLSIVKGILEAHGALYGVDSVVGEGSTFWFELDAIFEGHFES